MIKTLKVAFGGTRRQDIHGSLPYPGDPKHSYRLIGDKKWECPRSGNKGFALEGNRENWLVTLLPERAIRHFGKAKFIYLALPTSTNRCYGSNVIRKITFPWTTHLFQEIVCKGHSFDLGVDFLTGMEFEGS